MDAGGFDLENEKENLDLKIYFENGLQFKTNDLYVIMQMGSLTGFYSIFRLNINLFLDYPKLETSPLFKNSKGPLRSDINLKKPMFKKPSKETPSEPPEDPQEDLKKKSIASFKRSKSKHIINQYGQIVGVEPMSKDEKKENNEKIRRKSNMRLKKSAKSEVHMHNIFHPEDSMDEIEDLYGTENTFEVKHVKHSGIGNLGISEEGDLPEIAKKTTMRLTFSKADVDKANQKIPEDFEIIFKMRCVQENKNWSFEWSQLEDLRNELIRKLQENPQLGRVMLNGE